MSLLISTQQEFFRKLMGLFRICEDLENVDGLHMIYKIVRGISKYSFMVFYPQNVPHKCIYFLLLLTDMCFPTCSSAE